MAHTLLLVDDEAKVLESMAPYLRREGYEVATASNGKEALRKAREVKPAVVVLDWRSEERRVGKECRL